MLSNTIDLRKCAQQQRNILYVRVWPPKPPPPGHGTDVTGRLVVGHGGGELPNRCHRAQTLLGTPSFWLRNVSTDYCIYVFIGVIHPPVCNFPSIFVLKYYHRGRLRDRRGAPRPGVPRAAAGAGRLAGRKPPRAIQRQPGAKWHAVGRVPVHGGYLHVLCGGRHEQVGGVRWPGRRWGVS